MYDTNLGTELEKYKYILNMNYWLVLKRLVLSVAAPPEKQRRTLRRSKNDFFTYYYMCDTTYIEYLK